MTRFVIFLILIIVIIYVQAQGGKYSKERNNAQINDPLEGRQFRMIKIQQLWEKAKKVRRMMSLKINKQNKKLFFFSFIILFSDMKIYFCKIYSLEIGIGRKSA